MKNKGFTLLETVIALAIMTVAFASILLVQNGSIRSIERARQANIVSMLLRNKLIDVEDTIQGKGFKEAKESEEGTFAEPFQDYRWKVEIKEMKIPSLQVGQEVSQVQEIMSKLISKHLNESLRQVQVTVFWNMGKEEEKYSVGFFWVDFGLPFDLNG